MAFDTSPPADTITSSHMHSASSPSPSLNSSPNRHYYVAVDRIQFKMDTLVDLMGVAGKRPCLPIALCCSSRDELDAVCSALSNLSYVSISPLHSDLSEAERAAVLDKFRQTAAEWCHIYNILPEDDETKLVDKQSVMIVVTDACLPFVSSGEQPIHARILINFDLPTKKETYTRRTLTCLAEDGVVINMVVGGEVVTLKAIEESCGFLIAEMPINISEIL